MCGGSDGVWHLFSVSKVAGAAGTVALADVGGVRGEVGEEVVVARDHHAVPVRLRCQPCVERSCFGDGAVFGNVPAVHEHVACRHRHTCCQLVVRVRDDHEPHGAALGVSGIVVEGGLGVDGGGLGGPIAHRVA